MIDILDRVPPQAIDAEISILGACLTDPETVPVVIDLIKPQEFYRTAHQKIFKVIVELNDDEVPIDIISVSDELKRQKLLEEIGGTYYLTELSENIHSIASIEHHCKLVTNCYLLRSWIVDANNISAMCYEQKSVDDISKKIYETGNRDTPTEIKTLGSTIEDTFNYLDMRHNTSGIGGLTTGLLKLDELTDGLQPEDFIIIAGRPSMGKSGYALHIARRNLKEGKKIVLFSLEMSIRMLNVRLLSQEGNVDGHKLRQGRLSAKEWELVSKATQNLNEFKENFFMDETCNVSASYIRRKARVLKKKYSIDLIVVDYLQLMHETAESRQQEVSIISRQLKALAKELKVPVIALSQLSRANEARHNKRPMLSDLRESGAIEQDADMVLFLYRPEYYDKDEKDTTLCEIIIGKQRNGPVETVNVNFFKTSGRFEDRIYFEEG